MPSFITDRFDQEELKVYSALKFVILHSIRSLPIEPYISKVANVYDQDFDKSLLLSQLKLLPKSVEGMTISEYVSGHTDRAHKIATIEK